MPRPEATEIVTQWIISQVASPISDVISPGEVLCPMLWC